MSRMSRVESSQIKIENNKQQALISRSRTLRVALREKEPLISEWLSPTTFPNFPRRLNASTPRRLDASTPQRSSTHVSQRCLEHAPHILQKLEMNIMKHIHLNFLQLTMFLSSTVATMFGGIAKPSCGPFYCCFTFSHKLENTQIEYSPS